MPSVAHLGHAELNVTDLEKSRWFFTELLGLYVSHEEDDRVYLRAWQDWEHHTLVLTRAKESGLEHVAWRVSGPNDLAEYEKLFKKQNLDHWWVDGGSQIGHGDSLRFITPDGMPFELYWEAEKYQETNPELVSKLPSHPQRFTGKGVGPRRFDHVNMLVDNPAKTQEWLTGEMGIHHRYLVENDEGQRLGSWLSRTNVSHEIAVMRNRQQNGSLLHHVAYYLDSGDQLMRAATALADHDIEIEWGPGQHGTSGAIFLYCFEPSGNRVEIWTGGFLIFAPDWEPIRWEPNIGPQGLELWGSKAPPSYFTRGTPFLHKVPEAG